jgi:hypothetical protein
MIEPQARRRRQRCAIALALSHREKNLFFNSDVFQECFAKTLVSCITDLSQAVGGLREKLIQPDVFCGEKLAQAPMG